MKNLLVRIAAFAVTGALFVGALVFSVVVFAVAFAVFCLIFGFFWWKTRHLRRQMRQRRQGGEIIEGEVISPEEVRAGRRNVVITQHKGG